MSKQRKIRRKLKKNSRPRTKIDELSNNAIPRRRQKLLLADDFAPNGKNIPDTSGQDSLHRMGAKKVELKSYNIHKKRRCANIPGSSSHNEHKRKTKHRQFADGRRFYNYDIWVKRGKRWQCPHHISQLEEKPCEPSYSGRRKETLSSD